MNSTTTSLLLDSFPNSTDNDSLLLSDESASSAETLPDPLIKLIHDVLIVVLLIAVMFAMGCHITLTEVWQHVRRPIGIFIGMSSQFFLLPLAAFCLILLLGMDPNYATGMLVLACSPGGVTSNIFSYFCDGDVSLRKTLSAGAMKHSLNVELTVKTGQGVTQLPVTTLRSKCISVTMTTCSTVVALGMMPLNMWVYGHQLETGSVVIPYAKMSVSLASVTAPVGAGMLVRWKFPNAAPYITKIGSYAGFAIIFVCQTMELIIFPDIFEGITWRFYVALVVLPTIGLSLGYGLAFVCRQAPPVRKTIAIECSIQNIGTALTIISLSFPVEMQKRVLAFPWLYSIPLLTTCTVTVACYQLYKRTCFKDSPELNEKKINGKMNGIKSIDLLSNGKCEELQSFIPPEKLTTV